MPECTVSDCSKPRVNGKQEWCNSHYLRAKRHGSPTAGGPSKVYRGRIPCAVDGCETPQKSNGWCSLHLNRWRSTGDPTKVLVQRDTGNAQERFWKKVSKDGPPSAMVGLGNCWIWKAGKVKNYGQFVIRHGVMIPAHRWAYEEANGTVPVGLELDHLCRNRSCVRPSHLEAVTHRENVIRGIASRKAEEARHRTPPAASTSGED